MNISETINQEVIFLGCAILSGAILFLLYDVFRIFRRLFAHGNILIAVEDFIYWMICTGVVFLLLYRENDGMVRGVAFGGILLGMLFYYILFSRNIIRFNVFVLRTFGCVWNRVAAIFFGPLIRRGKKVRNFVIKQLKKIGRAVKMGLCKQ